jgi:hypothetical protein
MEIVLGYEYDRPSAFWRGQGIRVVPGDDPNGRDGYPVVRQPAFVWAKVRNGCDDRLANARVDFFLVGLGASLGSVRTGLIGTSWVTLLPGAVQDVLCVSPLISPRSGHGCLIVAASHPRFQLPANERDWYYLPQVGQRNIEILDISNGVPRVIALPVLGPHVEGDITVEVVPSGTAGMTLPPGAEELPPTELANVFLSHHANEDQPGVTVLTLPSGGGSFVYVTILPFADSGRGVQLFDIAFATRQGIFAGVSFLLFSNPEGLQ